MMPNLDFLTKPRSNSVKPTAWGGLLSLISLVVLAYAIFFEVLSFTPTTIDVEVSVENHPMMSHTAIIEVNLTVYDVSCILVNSIFTTDVEDVFNSIDTTFEKTRIYNNGTGIKFIPEEELLDQLQKATSDEEIKQLLTTNLVKGESWNLYGQVYVPKVGGSLTFSTLVDPLLLLLMHEYGHNIQIANHEVHSLKFINAHSDTLFSNDEDFLMTFDDQINTQMFKGNNSVAHINYLT